MTDEPDTDADGVPTRRARATSPWCSTSTTSSPRLRLARELRPWFGVAKVGLELFTAVGPDVIGPLSTSASRCSSTSSSTTSPPPSNKAARVLGALGAPYLTLHAHGGVDMLRAGVEGLAEGAAGRPGRARRRWRSPCSPATATRRRTSCRKRVDARASRPAAAGIVCAAADLPRRASSPPRCSAVVPGIRPAGVPTHDQARARPRPRPLDAGADLLVIGRAVTQADDPAGRRGRARRRARRGLERAAAAGRRGDLAVGSDAMPQPPALTPEQRQAALEKAAAGPPGPGRAEGEAQDGLAVSLPELFEQADSDDIVGKMKVLAVLESLPGVGKVKARRTMEEIGISETRRSGASATSSARRCWPSSAADRATADHRHLRPRRGRQGHPRRAARRRRTRRCG